MLYENSNILIIDDDEDIRKTLKDILSYKGYTVYQEGSGANGIECVYKNDIAVAIIDLKLKDIDGITVLKSIKEYSNDTECIILTGHMSSNSLKYALNYGAYHYYEKPYNIEKLVLTIQNALEKYHTNNKLKESEERLKLALTASGIGSWDYDYTDKKAHRNKEWAEMLGYEIGEISEKSDSWKDLIHPEDLNRVLEEVDLHEKGRKDEFKVEHRLRCADGNYKWILNCGKVIERDSKGKPLRALGVHIDINEQKELEEQIRKQDEEFKIIFNSSINPILVADDEGRYINANSAAESVFEYSVEELLKMKVSDLQTVQEPDAGERYKKYLEKGYEIGEFEFYSKSGKIKSIQYHAVRVRKDFNLSILSDITERKQAELEIEKSRNLLLRAEEVAKLGSWKWDIVNDEYTFSETWKNIHGTESDNISKNELFKFAYPEDLEKIDKAFNDALHEIKQYNIEHRIIRENDGEVRWVHAKAEVNFENGKPIKMFGTSQDITDKKQAEESLRKNEKRLREAQQIAHIGSWEYDIKIEKPIWSDEMFRIFGVDPADGEPAWESHRDMIHPDDWEKLDKAVKLAAKEGVPYDIEFRIITKEGKLKYGHTIGRGMQDSDGKLIKLQGTTQDITNKVEIEYALKSSEERFKFAVEATNDGIWDWNIETGEVFYSISWEKIIDETNLKPTYDTWKKRIHPEDRESVISSLEEHLRGTTFFWEKNTDSKPKMKVTSGLLEEALL